MNGRSLDVDSGGNALGDLRDYQACARDIVLRDLIGSATRSGYVELPTGGGKTRIAVAISIATAERLRTLVLVPNLEIADQAASAYEKVFGAEHVGRCYGKKHRQVDRQVTIAIPTSLTRRLPSYIAAGGPALVIADEAHHASDNSRYDVAIQAVLNGHPDARALGLTATPFRHDGKKMTLGRCLFSRSIEDLQAAGVLVPLESQLIEIDELRMSDVVTRSGDFGSAKLATVLREVTDAVVHRTGGLLRGRTTLVFAASIDHAKELAASFHRAGFASGFVYGEQQEDERRSVLERWRKRDLDVVVNVGCLLEGFDYPQINALLIARPTMSPGLYLQMLGRGLRTAPGKESCLVLDVAGNESPEDRRQILLRDLVKTRSAGRGIGGSARAGGGAKRRLFRDREGEFDLAWLENNGDEGLLIGKGMAVIACVDRDAGLYASAYSCKTEITNIGEPTSHAQAFTDVLSFAHEHLADGHVWRRDARWREGSASEKQRAHMKALGLLGHADPELTKGDAGEAISSYGIHRVAETLRRRWRTNRRVRPLVVSEQGSGITQRASASGVRHEPQQAISVRRIRIAQDVQGAYQMYEGDLAALKMNDWKPYPAWLAEQAENNDAVKTALNLLAAVVKQGPLTIGCSDVFAAEDAVAVVNLLSTKVKNIHLENTFTIRNQELLR